MKREILIIEIQDQTVLNAFEFVRNKFKNGKVPAKPHITIRGPYSNKISLKTINKFRSRLTEEKKLKINGVSRFDSKKEHVVYLSIESNALRKIWWKPDFPIDKFGFHPHITVFVGSEEAADKVFNDLDSLNLNGFIEDFILRKDTIGQVSLDL